MYPSKEGKTRRRESRGLRIKSAARDEEGRSEAARDEAGATKFWKLSVS